MSFKLKIAYGNTHKLVSKPKKSRTSDNENRHKWVCFAKILDDSLTNKYISKVKFGLHPSFGATEVEVKSSPFELKKIGWGYFTIPITIYFHKELKIPSVTVEHELCFDGEGQTKLKILKLNKDPLAK